MDFFLLLFGCITSVMLFKRMYNALVHLVTGLRQPRSLASDLTSRNVVFGVKYWVATSGTMAVIIALQAKYPVELAPWQLSTAFIVLCACLQPLVEDTGYKTLLRLSFLMLAGGLGLGAMSSLPFATNPLAIMLLICLVSFIFGHMNGVLAIKYPVFFFMVTIYSMLLCQYTGTSRGTLIFFGGRVAATAAGSALCMLFGVLLLPWHASQQAQEQLADCLASATSLLDRMWEDFCQAAHKAAECGEDMPASEYGEILKTRIDMPLGKVEEACKENVLPFHIPFIADRDLITPMPPVVKLALGSMTNLAGRLWSAQLAMAQNPWQGKTEVLAEYVPGLLSRSLGRLYARQVDEAMRAYIASCTNLAQACRDNLVAVRAAALSASRQAILAGLQDTEKERLALQQVLIQTLPATLELTASGGREAYRESLVFDAWIVSYLRSLDQVMGVARTLLLEECRKRDHYWSWLGCV